MTEEETIEETVVSSAKGKKTVKSLTGNIISMLSETKLKIIGAKIVKVPKELAEEHYKHLKEEKPDILGLSVVTQRVYAMQEILKRTSAKYKIVGGPHATHYANQILKKGADTVLIGSLADLEFKQAVETLHKGIVYCKTSIQDIKFPRRDFLKVEKYFPKVSVLFNANNRLPMFTSIGCPHCCTFCDVQNKRLELKSAKVVVDEMQYLYSIGCRSVHMLDDNFNINENHVKQILNEMDKRHFSIEWSGRGQARISEELARALAKHNFKRIHVGIESLSDDILKFFRKSVRTKDIYKFCNTMNKNNIDMVAYFILGTPIETKKYLNSLPMKIRELGLKYPYFNILFPAPNTEYYNQLLINGTYSKDYWADYMENPSPNFKIPYPYGIEKHKEIVTYANNLIKEFEKDK